jgi:hypothetical protein
LLVKDVIGTDDSLGMKTTAGSFALIDSVVKEVRRVEEHDIHTERQLTSPAFA